MQATVNSSALKGNLMQFNAAHCELQCSKGRLNAAQRSKASVMECSVVQCSAVQCSAVQCSAAQYIAVHCSAVQCSAAHDACDI